jgi:hypothetical protein
MHAVLVADQREHPGHHLGEPLLRSVRRHEPDRLALFGNRDALADEAVHVRVFLVEVQIEMELERLRRSGRLQGIMHRHGPVQGVERHVERAVIQLVGLVHRGAGRAWRASSRLMPPASGTDSPDRRRTR